MSEDLIRRSDAIKIVSISCGTCLARDSKDCEKCSATRLSESINALPSADAVDCTDFILWLLDEIMDEENWELNAVADGEIIARELKKLGLLEVKDGYYVRTPSADAVLLDIEKWRMWSHTYDNMCKGGDDE